jgi:thiamine pyrophosphokinase
LKKNTVRILDGRQELVVLRGNATYTFLGNRGDILSLLPLNRDAEGITLSGLKYPLDAETLYLGTARGVSNEFVHETAAVRIRHGLLLCIITRAGDVPLWGAYS